MSVNRKERGAMNELDFANYQMVLLVEAMYRQIESTYERSGKISRSTMVKNTKSGYALLFMSQDIAIEIDALLKTKHDCVKDSFAFLAPVINPEQ